MVNLENKKIVVTFLMHLGDLILITPFLQVLRRSAKNSHITLVIDKKLAEAVQYNPNVDTLLTIDKKGADNSLASLWCIGRELHEQHPDVLINLHPNERTSFFALAVGAVYFTGMSHFLVRPFMSKYLRLDRRNRHAADMYVNILEQLGIMDTTNEGLQIFSCPQWDEMVQRFYAVAGLKAKEKVIGFNIGSAVPEKRWSPQRFALVADYFAEQQYRTIFFGAPMELQMVQEAVSYMRSVPIIGTGKFSLGELATAIKRCSLFITNDSGPMHVAVSQGVPIVALYGPSNPKFYGPYTENAIILESMDHYAVGKSMKKIIRQGDYKGVDVISVDAVIRAAERLLTRK